MDRNRKDDQKPVRVAILDSGVDATHPDISLALETKQIAAYKGFPESLNPLQDKHGHGTHGASVLMKTAPNATLYVACMVDDKGEISEKNDYLNTVKVTNANMWINYFRQYPGQSNNMWKLFRSLGE